MRHDDHGDEGEGSGERPDPSTRHWRHPSELGQQHGLPHADPTPISVGAPTGGSAAVWPLVAVGGCLAIAALGVIGLTTDLGRADSLQAGTAATVAPTQTTFRTAAASASAEPITPSSTASTVGLGPAPSDDDDPSDQASGPTTSLARPRNPGQTSARSADGADTPSTDLFDSRSLAEMAQVPVYGVYAAPGQDEGQLGSFIMVDDKPVTSASSLDDRRTVWLRVETRWLEAVVVAVDPITDVALLDLVDEPDGAALPTLPRAVEPVGLGAPAMVGYGDPDGSPDGGEWAELTDDGEPEESIEDWVSASDRRGVIYSLTKPLVTGTGRLVHDPIRLHTIPGPADAGSPLRNRSGEIIGLVAHSTMPQVAAVPIDRVVEAVGWLQQTGQGDPAWLGLTIVAQSRGLVVTAISEGSPASQLAPGDVIVAVDRQLVFHPDSLRYAARLAGPGQLIELTVDRQNRRQTVPIEVGSAPLP